MSWLLRQPFFRLTFLPNSCLTHFWINQELEEDWFPPSYFADSLFNIWWQRKNRNTLTEGKGANTWAEAFGPISAINRMEEGDEVMALEGSDVLWVLRPVGNNRYGLVGGIWADGLMFGEAYEGLDPDEVGYDIEIV